MRYIVLYIGQLTASSLFKLPSTFTMLSIIRTQKQIYKKTDQMIEIYMHTYTLYVYMYIYRDTSLYHVYIFTDIHL